MIGSWVCERALLFQLSQEVCTSKLQEAKSILPKKAPSSLLVSLADKVGNAEAILNDYRNMGDELWDRSTRGRDGTIWYYRQLSEIFDAAMPEALARQLAVTVLPFQVDPFARAGVESRFRGAAK